MPQLTNFLQLQTNSGDPVTIGGTTITPQSQALIVRFPFGGFVWNRPIAVIVDRAGQSQRIPIVNVTLIALLGLIAFSVIINLLAAHRRSQ